MKLENWSLVGAPANYGFIYPDFTEDVPFKVWGKVYESEDFPDGTFISTSIISRYSDTHVITQNGKRYELGEINSDYNAFIKAVKNNIPVLKNWEFNGSPEKKMISGSLFRDTSKLQIGVFEKILHATITSVNVADNLYELNTGKTVFIDWLSTSSEERNSWSSKFPNLSYFANMKIKINF